MNGYEHVRLIKPVETYISSYLDACREFKETGLLTYSFHDPDEYGSWGPTLIQTYENHSKGKGLPQGYVPATALWLVDIERGEFVAEGSIRHELTPSLMCYGGHIGYAVRTSQWNKGYGTYLLSLLLKEAARLGIGHALITCDDNNYGSRKVIEKNAGVYQDTVENTINGKAIRTRRYWVSTTSL